MPPLDVSSYPERSYLSQNTDMLIPASPFLFNSSCSNLPDKGVDAVEGGRHSLYAAGNDYLSLRPISCPTLIPALPLLPYSSVDPSSSSSLLFPSSSSSSSSRVPTAFMGLHTPQIHEQAAYVQPDRQDVDWCAPRSLHETDESYRFQDRFSVPFDGAFFNTPHNRQTWDAMSYSMSPPALSSPPLLTYQDIDNTAPGHVAAELSSSSSYSKIAPSTALRPSRVVATTSSASSALVVRRSRKEPATKKKTTGPRTGTGSLRGQSAKTLLPQPCDLTPTVYSLSWHTIDLFRSLYPWTSFACQLATSSAAVGQPPVCCGAMINSYEEFRIHLKNDHLLTRGKNETNPKECTWAGCRGRYKNPGGCWRHVEETHTPIFWVCPHAGCHYKKRRLCNFLKHVEGHSPGEKSCLAALHKKKWSEIFAVANPAWPR